MNTKKTQKEPKRTKKEQNNYYKKETEPKRTKSNPQELTRPKITKKDQKRPNRNKKNKKNYYQNRREMSISPLENDKSQLKWVILTLIRGENSSIRGRVTICHFLILSPFHRSLLISSFSLHFLTLSISSFSLHFPILSPFLILAPFLPSQAAAGCESLFSPNSTDQKLQKMRCATILVRKFLIFLL